MGCLKIFWVRAKNHRVEELKFVHPSLISKPLHLSRWETGSNDKLIRIHESFGGIQILEKQSMNMSYNFLCASRSDEFVSNNLYNPTKIILGLKGKFNITKSSSFYIWLLTSTIAHIIGIINLDPFMDEGESHISKSNYLVNSLFNTQLMSVMPLVKHRFSPALGHTITAC